MQSFFIRRISSFTYLNVTQFLGALNDNIYKLLIVYFFIHKEGIEYSHRILAITGIIFVLPFLLFSASSGTLADRFSKRNIIALTKVFELFIMLLGLASFVYESKLGSYCVLFLLATQSAVFSPSKYGIIPELVSSEKVSNANGIMTSFTFLAIILGTFCASFLVDITGYNFIFAAIFCVFIALVGMVTSFCIEYTPPSGSLKRFNSRFLYEIVASLNIARQEPSLLMAIIGSAFFLFLGAYVQLNMIPYAVQVLHLSEVQGGYMFLLTAMGIGTGAFLAGKISGKTVELGLVPLAGIGIMICCYLLDFYSNHLLVVIPLVVMTGMFGGIYQVPLDSFIQVASPNRYRGQIVAATNFLSFFGVFCASTLLYVAAEIFAISPDKGFTLIGNMTLFITILLGFQFFDYLTRFIGMLLAKMHFRTSFIGQENVPQTPAIYVCTHTAWNDTLLLLSSQRRRVRFFIQQEQEHSPWLRRLYHLLRVIFIPPIEPLENNQDCLTAIKNTLKKGFSVCIFITNTEVEEEIKKLQQSYSFREILDELECPMIPVVISKGQKEKTAGSFQRLREKLRIPAAVSFGTRIRLPTENLPV